MSGGSGTSVPLVHVHILLVQAKSGFSCAAYVIGSSDKAVVNFLKEAYTRTHAVLSFVSRKVCVFVHTLNP